MTGWQEQFEKAPHTPVPSPSPSSDTHVPIIVVRCLSAMSATARAGAPREEHHPATDDWEGWQHYWANKGQPWRTEPEISPCRQYALSQ